MSALVLAEHDNSALSPATLNAVAAALAISQDVDLIVAGSECSAVVTAAGAVAGVRTVLHADAAHYAHALAENLAPLIVAVADGYEHVLTAATTTGKNVMPRVAALLDVAQISDIIGVEDHETFMRPIYAGNVIATVRSSDATKVITVRTTGFDAVADTGGSAAVETVEALADSGLSQFVGEELTKSDRPELTAADIIVSGGRGVGSSENFAIIEALAAMPAMCRTIIRSAKPAKWWHPVCTLPSGFPGRFNISLA